MQTKHINSLSLLQDKSCVGLVDAEVVIFLFFPTSLLARFLDKRVNTPLENEK